MHHNGKQLLEIVKQTHSDFKVQKLKLIGDLLNQGVDPNTKDETFTTPLLYAAQNGDREIVELLIQSGADINCHNEPYRITPLMVAAAQNQIEVVKILIAAGADINAVNDDGTPTLAIAVHRGYLQIVTLLLAAGARVDIEDKRWRQSPDSCDTR